MNPPDTTAVQPPPLHPGLPEKPDFKSLFEALLRRPHTLVATLAGRWRWPMIVWTIVFLLVTMQLTTSQRPILGRTPEFLTHEKKFFIQHWSDTMGTSLNAKAEPDCDSAARIRRLRRATALFPRFSGVSHPGLYKSAIPCQVP
jgi:hypothetical protein